MPRITIVLPVYNHARYLDEALRSLFEQEFSDYRIVAVDDGSTDTSLEILHRYRPRLEVIEGSHQGPAAARNRALKASDSEYVAFMDADDVCAPERLRVELGTIERENLGLVASALSFIDASGQPLPGLWTRTPDAANDYWGALVERNWIGAPSVVLRRRVLESAGVFDERFTHAEDYDLWLRIGRAHSIGFIETPLVQCRRHRANTSMDIPSHQRFEMMALQKVHAPDARDAFGRLYASPQRRDEAWIWFLLRSGSAAFAGEASLALARHPTSRALRFALGVFQFDSGRPNEARAAFEVLHEHDTAGLHNLGVLAAFCGDLQTAESHLSAALRRRPDYHDAKMNLSALRNGRELRLTRRPFRESLVPMKEPWT